MIWPHHQDPTKPDSRSSVYRPRRTFGAWMRCSNAWQVIHTRTGLNNRNRWISISKRLHLYVRFGVTSGCSSRLKRAVHQTLNPRTEKMSEWVENWSANKVKSLDGNYGHMKTTPQYNEMVEIDGPRLIRLYANTVTARGEYRIGCWSRECSPKSNQM